MKIENSIRNLIQKIAVLDRSIPLPPDSISNRDRITAVLILTIAHFADNFSRTDSHSKKSIRTISHFADSSSNPDSIFIFSVDNFSNHDRKINTIPFANTFSFAPFYLLLNGQKKKSLQNSSILQNCF